MPRAHLLQVAVWIQRVRNCAARAAIGVESAPGFIKSYFGCAESPITPRTKVDPFLIAVPHD
jgi:hypothetical protein